MRKFLISVLLLLLVSSAAATSIDSENVVVDLEDSSVEVEVVVEELTKSAFSYIVAYPISNVEAQIDGEEVQCEVNKLSIGSEILCETDQREDFTVNMSFTADNLVTSRENADIFRYSYSVYRPTDAYNFRVLLPAGAGLLDQENLTTPVVSPENYSLGSDGRQIYLEWSDEPGLGQTMNYKVTYENFSSPLDYARPLASIIVLALILSGVYVWRRQENGENVENVYEDLSEDEIDVVEILRKNNGEMLQKDIVNASEYSKAKISGVVSGLVEKEIVEKKKEGRSNKLTISDRFAF